MTRSGPPARTGVAVARRRDSVKDGPLHTVSGGTMRRSRIISGIASAVLATGVVALGTGGVGATGAPPRRAARAGARPRPARGPGPLRQRRGDLPGEPQLRQPVRRVGQGRRPQGRRARGRPGLPDHPGRAGRHAVRLPAPERREPDLADAAADHLLRPRARGAQQRLRERAVHDRRLHRAAGHDLPRPGRAGTERGAQGHRRSPAAARATWCTASTRSSTSSTAASRTAT